MIFVVGVSLGASLGMALIANFVAMWWVCDLSHMVSGGAYIPGNPNIPGNPDIPGSTDIYRLPPLPPTSPTVGIDIYIYIHI